MEQSVQTFIACSPLHTALGGDWGEAWVLPPRTPRSRLTWARHRRPAPHSLLSRVREHDTSDGGNEATRQRPRSAPLSSYVTWQDGIRAASLSPWAVNNHFRATPLPFRARGVSLLNGHCPYVLPHLRLWLSLANSPLVFPSWISPAVPKRK